MPVCVCVCVWMCSGYHPDLSFPFPYCAVFPFAEPNSAFACIIFNYECAHFGVKCVSLYAPLAALPPANLSRSQHNIIIKIVYSIRLSANFTSAIYISTIEWCDDENIRTSISLVAQCSRRINCRPLLVVILSQVNIERVNWQTNNLISILESANWPIKKLKSPQRNWNGAPATGESFFFSCFFGKRQIKKSRI